MIMSFNHFSYSFIITLIFESNPLIYLFSVGCVNHFNPCWCFLSILILFLIGLAGSRLELYDFIYDAYSHSLSDAHENHARGYDDGVSGHGDGDDVSGHGDGDGVNANGHDGVSGHGDGDGVSGHGDGVHFKEAALVYFYLQLAAKILKLFMLSVKL